MGILHNTESKPRAGYLLQRSESAELSTCPICASSYSMERSAQPPSCCMALRSRNTLPTASSIGSPKADPTCDSKRLVTLSRADRLTFRSDLVAEDPTAFKRRLWTRAPEERLLQYLRTIPPMGAFVQEFKAFKRSG